MRALTAPAGARLVRFSAVLAVGALPGTPAAHEPLDAIIERAVTEACAYRDAGFTAIAMENMHDRPYLKGRVGPEITASRAVI